MKKGKIIIVSAPSGCGKSTIIGRIIDDPELRLRFSVSATNRSPRCGETDGVSYHFLTTDQFLDHVAKGHFIEHEEVYPGRYYGTLRSEVDRICSNGDNCILDIDVKGAINVKRIFGNEALALFIQPPSIETLHQRLVDRHTDSPEDIERRVSKAALEISHAPAFDRIIVNDNLDTAVSDTRAAILDFLAQ